MKILIVEDEDKLRHQLTTQLKERQYIVEQARDGEEAVYMGLEFPVDLAIVDLGLPKINGVDVIRKWREKGISFPVLVLTARGNWEDKVEGLDAGADDYLVKPFHIEELVARVKALLRRSAGHSSSELKFGNIVIDLSEKQVRLNNQALDLTAYEYNTLEYLALKPGKTISKTELTEHLYEQDYERDSNVIEVFVGRLRKKLDPSGTSNPIKTVRGQGYLFTLRQDES